MSTPLSAIAPAQAPRIAPAIQARLIYNEARAGVATDLWQAAIGHDAAAGDAPATGDAMRAEAADLTALLLDMDRNLRADGPPRALPHAPPPPPIAQTTPETGRHAGRDGKADAGGGRPDGGDRRMSVAAGHGAALNGAAARTGIPAPVIAAIIDAEAARDSQGRWNSWSRNPRSSAAGLGQFLSGTWRDQAQRPGTWLNDTARTRGWLDERGHVRSEAKAELFALRYDARASIEATADLASYNVRHLRAAGIAIGNDHASLGRAAYVGHHLGMGDAVRFLGRGLVSPRAERLLAAQVGQQAAARRILASGDAATAHRAWLTNYMAHKLRPDLFQELL